MVQDYGLKDKTIVVGIIGTGYAAKKRAEAFTNHPSSKLVAVVGNTPEKTNEFCETFDISAIDTYQELVLRRDIDLVCISNINKQHGEIVRQALLADKHVIVEYPLAIDAAEAEELIELAKVREKLLHVEHIEIIGGVHRAIKENIEQIGTPYLARYTTILAKKKKAPHWTYSYDDYAFPLIAALSRINRFVDLFGEVDRVGCVSRFWDAEISGYFTACYCQAQLQFQNQMYVHITYGKGEKFKISDRTLEIYGDEGTLRFVGEKGEILRGKEKIEIGVGSRRGLFNQDTEMVIDRLRNNTPLYIDNRQSAYSLKVAQACEEAYQQQQIISIE